MNDQNGNDMLSQLLREVEEPAVTEVVEDTTLPESVGQGVPEEVNYSAFRMKPP